MQVLSSLRSAKKRHRDCKVVRRRFGKNKAEIEKGHPVEHNQTH